MPERSALHALPHPGGGGETYVDLLGEMLGYRFERVYLAPSPTPSARELASGLAAAYRAAVGHDLLHAHGEVAAALCLPLLAARPSVVTLHGLHLVRRLSGLSTRVAALSLRAVLRAADRTICVSNAEHDVVAALVGPRAARRAVVVRNGVHLAARVSDAERAKLRRALGIGESEPLAIWVGSLDERKDPLTAVRAAERAGVALLVVGDGPLRPQVEASARRHVRVLGRRGDVPRLLATADFFVTTSVREGLAFSLLEAMAAGLPSIVSALPENVEAAGDTGVAYDAEDGLVAALGRLAGSEPERTGLGERARRRIAERFTAEAMIARTRAIYNEVIDLSSTARAQ